MFRIKNVPSLPAHKTTASKPSNLVLETKEKTPLANSHNNKEKSLNAMRMNVREKRERFEKNEPMNNKFQIRNKTNLKPLRDGYRATIKYPVHNNMRIEENKNDQLQQNKGNKLNSIKKVEKQLGNRNGDNLEGEKKDEEVMIGKESQIEELPKIIEIEMDENRQREILKKEEEEEKKEMMKNVQQEQERQIQKDRYEEEIRKLREEEEKKDQEQREKEASIMMAKIQERRNQREKKSSVEKEKRDEYWKRFDKITENISISFGCRVGGMMVSENPLFHFEMDDIVLDAQIFKILQLTSHNFPSGPAIEILKKELSTINASYMEIKFDSDKERLAEGLKGYRIELFNKIGDLIMTDKRNGYEDDEIPVMEIERGGSINREVHLIQGIPQNKIHRVVSEIECSSDSDCQICLELIKTGQICSQLICKHIFHTDCLNDWIENTGNCPACRKNLKE